MLVLGMAGRGVEDVLGSKGCVVRRAMTRGTTLGPWLFGVNGRYRLTAGGRVVVPERDDPFFDRHPRTFARRTAAGTVMLVTVDGRQPGSVGTTPRETAEVALALGLRHAVNLDGGGSTTMVVGGQVVSSPSGSQERAVGVALVFVPGA